MKLPGAAERLLAWLVTGPLGHFLAGVIDWLAALTRWQWERLQRKRRVRRAPSR